MFPRINNETLVVKVLQKDVKNDVLDKDLLNTRKLKQPISLSQSSQSFQNNFSFSATNWNLHILQYNHIIL